MERSHYIGGRGEGGEGVMEGVKEEERGKEIGKVGGRRRGVIHIIILVACIQHTSCSH